jgi:LacI family transcriptional regulator
MKATIRNVAKLAGVAPSTVSHYLNQSAPLSSTTAKNVERAIATLNYRVNLGARGLRQRKTLSIGLVIPNITTPFFGEIASVIENMFWEKGYQTLLCISERDVEREFLQVLNLASRQVDGLLVAYSSEHSKVFEAARTLSIPTVFVDRAVSGQYSVATDNFYGGVLAARHLYELGHRRIGVLCGEIEIRNVAERLAGFQAELAQHGIEIRPEHIVHGRQELQFGLKVSQLFGECCPTAIFATNDIVAVGAWRTLIEAGYRLPEDMSVVGFDDIEISRYLVPPLTTVAQPTREIGARAVKLLLQLIADRSGAATPVSVLVSPTLKIRGSTALAKTSPGPST